ncbi:MAG: hypothetical protein ACE5KV_06920 [Thermoplasmata archaeon]
MEEDKILGYRFDREDSCGIGRKRDWTFINGSRRARKSAKTFFVVVLFLISGILVHSPQHVRAQSSMSEGDYFVYNTTENFTVPEVSQRFFEINITVLDINDYNTTLRYHSYDPRDLSPSHNFTDVYNKTTRESEKFPGYYAWLWILQGDLQNGSVLVENHIATVGNSTPSYEVLLWNDSFGNFTEYYYRSADLIFEYSVDHRVNATFEFNGTVENVTYGSGGGSRSKNDSSKGNSPSSGGGPGTLSVYPILPPWDDYYDYDDGYEVDNGRYYSNTFGDRWGVFDTYAYAWTPLHGEAFAEGYVDWTDSFTPPSTRRYWVVFSFEVTWGYIWTKAMAAEYLGIRLGTSAGYNYVNFGGYIWDTTSNSFVFYEYGTLDYCYSDSSSPIPWPSECREEWDEDLFFVYGYADLRSDRTYGFRGWYYNSNLAWSMGVAYAIAQSDLYGEFYALELYY